ncbi:MAG: DUF4271 domain-containing protein [Ginsengibacter sp.]
MRKLKLILIFILVQQIKGYGQLKSDSSNLLKLNIDTSSISDTIKPPVKNYQSLLSQLVSVNKYINLRHTPVSFSLKPRQAGGKEYLFYLLSSIILILGLLRIFYTRYFHNIFRVFFNTSLRQNQLTDLLLQARLPSLIFNIFFSITGGVYIWQLLSYYYSINTEYNPRILFFCIVSVGGIYTVKFCVLKLIGWLTGMDAALNTYIFVIFLINKIIGVTLLPFIVLLAFARPVLVHSAIIISLLVLTIFFMMRFLRSYGLLQQQLHLSRLHFLLYIISLEILPLLIIYKLLLRFFLQKYA